VDRDGILKKMSYRKKDLIP